jgi:putative heme iron utilization protein
MARLTHAGADQGAAFSLALPMRIPSSHGKALRAIRSNRAVRPAAARYHRVRVVSTTAATAGSAEAANTEGSHSPRNVQRFADALTDHRLTPGVRARTVVHVCRTGTLCTASARHDGAPFGSHVDFILDEEGSAVFLLAAAATHTKNIAIERRVSLYCQPPSTSGQDGCRVTLVGDVSRMSEADASNIRDDYIDAHAHAADALAYPDLFAFHRMTVRDVYFVGGFGVVSQWVDPADFAKSEPDPLAHDAPGLVAEINQNRQQDMLRLCEVYLGLERGGKCTMMGLDRLGFDLRVRSISGDLREYRVAFRESVQTRFDCQSALVKAFQEAWERQNGHAALWESEEARPAVMYFALT